MARSLSKHDSSLDPRVDKLCRRDVIDHIKGDKLCAGIRAHMRLAREHPIAVAAKRHEIIGRKLVVAANVERFAVAAWTTAITRSAPAARAFLALARTAGIVGEKTKSSGGETRAAAS
jgi:hypothetical protein